MMVGLAMLTDLAVVGGLSIPPLSIAFASHVEISFCGLEAKLRKNIALRVCLFVPQGCCSSPVNLPGIVIPNATVWTMSQDRSSDKQS